LESKKEERGITVSEAATPRLILEKKLKAFELCLTDGVKQVLVRLAE
jgi:hypothetical protein